MKVTTTVVGVLERFKVPWPDGWPPPHEGDVVETAHGPLYVRTVVWYPAGNDEGGEPFVYVVLGLTRRES